MGTHPDILIHIGFHKTGTSFLQSHVFNRTDIGYGLIPVQRSQLEFQLLYTHPYLFDKTITHDLFQEAIESRVTAGLFPVISQERLSGELFQGAISSLNVLERLHQILPQAHILIIIREQESMILSAYNQYVRRGGTETLRQFLKEYPSPMVHWHRIQFAYHHLIHAYQTKFGKENVLVLPFELFRNDPESYLRQIFKLSNLTVKETVLEELLSKKPSNISMQYLRLEARRWFNHFAAHPTYVNLHPIFEMTREQNNALNGYLIYRKAHWLSGWDAKIKNHQQRYIREQIGDYYVESNRKTAELTGLDLSSYGYRIE